MRRRGSAAPQSSWSPMVKAPRYSGPIAILRTRPTGMVMVPVTATGVSESFAYSAMPNLGATFTWKATLNIDGRDVAFCPGFDTTPLSFER